MGIAEMFGKMVGMRTDKSTVGNVLKCDIALSDAMVEAQSVWREMYERPRGLHLAAAVSSELARMITIELSSQISGSARAEYLNRYYREVVENLRVPVELGCATGGMVFKPYVRGGELAVDFVRADEFFPTEFDDAGNICGAVFVQRKRRGGVFLTRLERHKLSDGEYTVSNRAFSSTSPGYLGHEISLAESGAWADLAAEMTLGNIRRPLFGYFKPALANSVDFSRSVGVSVFANAVNLIEDADRQYERMLWEFESGERALIANSMAFRRGKDGRLKLPDRRLYKTLDVEDADFFKEWSPTLRDESLVRGLDKIFRQIEFACGLAYGTLSDVQTKDRTAEEIRNSKQRSYATVSDNQKALKVALENLIYAMDVWCTLYKLAPSGGYSVDFDFDDSIAADRQAEFEEKMELVSRGIMMPWEMRAWYFGENEETARSRCESEKKYTSKDVNMFKNQD